MSQVVSDNIYIMEERGKRIEKVVDIYQTLDAVQRQETKADTDSKDQTQRTGTGGDTAESKRYRLTVLCIVLLCVLLLGAVTALWVTFSILSTENGQLQSRFDNLTAEQNKLLTGYKQLQSSFNNLTVENNQLQSSFNNLTVENKQLQSSFNNVTVESKQLQSSFNNLTVERNQLQKDIDQFNSRLSALDEGWRYFKSNIYYISMESKTWSESRQDCRGRGADLVIINTKEEQDFISKQLHYGDAWIGLSDQVTEGDWRWVDGSKPSITFWADREPNNAGDEDCGVVHGGPIDRPWNDLSCSFQNQWICEKAFS